jgi:putative GTP pyrophosphokinase
MTEEEFIARFEAEQGMLLAWGNYISSTVCNDLQARLDDAFHGFLKIKPEPRLKGLNSALHKAFVVKKGKYTHPYDQMEDKVGVRFVVLLGANVDQVARVVEGISDWESRKDLDFQNRRVINPYSFDRYQSLHYVVKASQDITYQGIVITKGTPCEIQIRTLLQHAHSELTHDSFYKPDSDTWRRQENTVERLVARGMALVETTDALFEDVMNEIKRESAETDRWIDDLATVYRVQIGLRNFDREAFSNHLIVDAYLQARPSLDFEKVKAFFEKNTAHVERIRERASTTHLYRLPAILLAYYVAKHHKHTAKQNWPLTERSLEDIFTDVGHSLD